jgi:hypothetical protein
MNHDIPPNHEVSDFNIAGRFRFQAQSSKSRPDKRQTFVRCIQLWKPRPRILQQQTSPRHQKRVGIISLHDPTVQFFVGDSSPRPRGLIGRTDATQSTQQQNDGNQKFLFATDKPQTGTPRGQIMHRIGNTGLIAIRPRTPHRDTEVRVRIAPILVVGPLNGGGMIAPRNLQQSNTPFNALDDKVSTRFILLFERE